MTNRGEYEAQNAATMIAGSPIASTSRVKGTSVDHRPVCLVTTFGERDDLPSGALLCRMSADVAATLSRMGLNEPVSLSQLSGKWWIANVDRASVKPEIEVGACTARVIASSECLICQHAYYFCEVIGGPFDGPEDANGCYFVTARFDRSRVGDRALFCELPAWMVERLVVDGMIDHIPFAAMRDKWWVCGLAGGVCSTAEIERALICRDAMHAVTDGPFATREMAEHAFDCLWESSD